jgi:hypothetical protein
MPRAPTISALIILSSALTLGACNCENGEQLHAEKGKLTADPMSVDFGQVVVGAEQTQAISLENTGSFVLKLQDPTLSDTTNFAIAQNGPSSLQPGEKGTIVVSFHPSMTGNFTGQLTLNNDGTDPMVNVALTGQGIPLPALCTLSLTPAAIDFSGVMAGQGSDGHATLKNVSTVDCTIQSMGFSGSSANQFSTPTMNPMTLASMSSLDVVIHLRRNGDTQIAASFDVQSNDNAMPKRSVLLTASGNPIPGLCVMPTSIHFGSTMMTATQDVTLTACGDHDVSIRGLDWTTPDGTISLRNPPALPFTISRGMSTTVTVQYAPPAMNANNHAVLHISSDDPLVPTVDVDVTGSPDIVPPSAGRYLYFWRATPQGGSGRTSEIVQLPLQGGGAPVQWWGQRTPTGSPGATTGCPGCHQVSPDGRYVAIVEVPMQGTDSLYVVDTTNSTQIMLPAAVQGATSFSWRPKVNPPGGAPYQYVASVGGKLMVGSLMSGSVSPLSGANDDILSSQAMPSWGPNGQIAFVRGAALFYVDAPVYKFIGKTDVWLIPEGGGTATQLAGASQNNMANFYPAFSPNGKWVVISQSASGITTFGAPDAQLRLVNADNSGQALMLPNINGSMGATDYANWSTDGSFLGFSSNRPGGAGDWDIYIAPIDQNTGVDGSPTNVAAANTAEFEHGLQWSP